MRWVIKDNQKFAIRHVQSVIKPAQLRTRIEQDLSLSKISLKDNITGFMKHCIDLSGAFEKLDNGNPRAKQNEKGSGNYKKSDHNSKA